MQYLHSIIHSVFMYKTNSQDLLLLYYFFFKREWRSNVLEFTVDRWPLFHRYIYIYFKRKKKKYNALAAVKGKKKLRARIAIELRDSDCENELPFDLSSQLDQCLALLDTNNKYPFPSSFSITLCCTFSFFWFPSSSSSSFFSFFLICLIFPASSFYVSSITLTKFCFRLHLL
jgi:hypothetical protein